MYPTIELTKEEYQKFSKNRFGSKHGAYGVVNRFYQDFAIKIWSGIEQEVLENIKMQMQLCGSDSIPYPIGFATYQGKIVGCVMPWVLGKDLISLNDAFLPFFIEALKNTYNDIDEASSKRIICRDIDRTSNLLYYEDKYYCTITPVDTDLWYKDEDRGLEKIKRINIEKFNKIIVYVIERIVEGFYVRMFIEQHPDLKYMHEVNSIVEYLEQLKEEVESYTHEKIYRLRDFEKVLERYK